MVAYLIELLQNYFMSEFDSSKLKWAVDDLFDIQQSTPGGGAFISEEFLYRTREATRVIVNAIFCGDLVLNEEMMESGKLLELRDQLLLSKEEAVALRERLALREKDISEIDDELTEISGGLTRAVEILGNIHQIGNGAVLDDAIKLVEGAKDKTESLISDVEPE